MLVFGAVQFISHDDGSLEIVHGAAHQFITRHDVRELNSWLLYHIDNSLNVKESRYIPPPRYAPNNVLGGVGIAQAQVEPNF